MLIHQDICKLVKREYHNLQLYEVFLDNDDNKLRLALCIIAHNITINNTVQRRSHA